MAIIEIIYVPQETVNDDIVTLGQLFVNNLAKVDGEELLCEMETSKANIEIRSPRAGYVEMLHASGAEVKVGDCLAYIHDSPVLESTALIPKDELRVEQTIGVDKGFSVFSREALHLIQEHGLSEADFDSSGFVRSADVLEKLKLPNIKRSGTSSAAQGFWFQDVEVVPKLAVSTDAVTVSLNKIHEIKYLLSSQNYISSNVSIKLDLPPTFMDGSSGVFMNLRSSLTPLILIHTCALLRQFKVFNAFFHGNQIHYYDEVCLGYAMDMDKGLKVVNLGDLSQKSVKEVNNRILDYVRQYISNSIPARDLGGSTFTVTDLSSEGCLSFTPLINMYQSAILGIAAVDAKQKENGVILTLTFDHRVSEGRTASQFLKALKQKVEAHL